MNLTLFTVGYQTHTPVFTAALFMIAKTWKQPKCPSTDEWMKMWCLYTVELLSHKKGDYAIYSDTDGTRGCYAIVK